MNDGSSDTAHSDSDESDRPSRRRFLALQATLLAGAAAGCNLNGGTPLATDDETPGGRESPAPGTPTGTGTETGRPSTADRSGETGQPTETERGDGPVANTVTVSPGDRTDRPVSDQLFGRLNEHYCAGTIYPGVYSEHVKNPAFYRRTWSPEDPFDSKTFFDPATIPRADGVPFPWEPVGESGVTFELRDGGVAAVDSTAYQRVSVDGATGGVAQKVVLPDFRTLAYDLGLSVRGEGVETLSVTVEALREPSPNSFETGETVASAAVDLTGEWTRHDLDLALRGALGDQFDAGGAGVETPYGEYRLAFTVEGSGHVDIDRVNLAAADAVAGKFNPSTVALLREKSVTWLKWPGGNFTSQYAWRDGVGPREERPSRFNHAWGGVDPNYFGTAEYLELCELCDLTPRITVGWWDDPPEWAAERAIRPEDAAAWVEYCNGSTDTEMGALRAEHGYDEPWGVTDWEVGNEVYGEWQRGDTQDPAVFATGGGPEDRVGFNAYYDAMTAVDDSISVYADAMSPLYQEPTLPDPQAWNSTLFELSGDRIDGVDLHHYCWGIRDAAVRRQWYEDHTAGTPRPGYWEYSEVLVSFPTQFGAVLDELATKAAEAGVEDFEINVGEWGLFPAVDGPYPGPETTPGGAYHAGMLNAFIRQSEHVREACSTWVPVKLFPPEFVQFPPDPNPLAPAGTVHTLYATLFEGDREWHAVGVDLGGASRTVPETGYRIRRAENVPYVDAAALRRADGRDLAVFATNRNLWSASELTLELGADYAGTSVAVTRLRATASERPLPHAFQESWGEPGAYEVTQSTASVNERGTLTLTLGPASVVRLLVDGDGDGPVTEDDGVWTGIEGVLGDGRPYAGEE